MQVLVPTALRSYTGASHVQASGSTLHALFDDLDHSYPGLRFRVVDEQNQLRPNMRVFVNGLAVRDLQHPLVSSDFVALVLAEFKVLHAGKAVRFGLRPLEVVAWLDLPPMASPKLVP